MMHVIRGGRACGRALDSIEGVSGEIHLHDQFDQSSKNFTGDYFWHGIYLFFSVKSGTPLSFRSRFFFPGKKAVGQILTGLVVLVVDMDSACFHINVLLRVQGVD